MGRPESLASVTIPSPTTRAVLGTSAVSTSGHLLAFALYTLLASGIPFVIYIAVLRSQKAMQKMNNVTSWVMRNRRRIASWFGIILGTFLIGDAALGLIFKG